MKRICFALAFSLVHVLPVLVLAQPAPDDRSRHALLRSAPTPMHDRGGHMPTPAASDAPRDDLGRPPLAQSDSDMPIDDLGQHLLAQTAPDDFGQYLLARTAIDVPADFLAGQHTLALLDAAALSDDRSVHILTPATQNTPPDARDQRILAQPAPVMPPDMLDGPHALAQPDPNAPHDDLGQHIGNVIDAVRSGSAIAIAAALIMLLTSLFKAPWLGSIVLKIPKRWRIAIPVILSGVAGVLSSIVGGIPWQEAVLVGLFAGPTAVFAHEAVVEAILGRARTRTPHLAS